MSFNTSTASFFSLYNINGYKVVQICLFFFFLNRHWNKSIQFSASILSDKSIKALASDLLIPHKKSKISPTQYLLHSPTPNLHPPLLHWSSSTRPSSPPLLHPPSPVLRSRCVGRSFLAPEAVFLCCNTQIYLGKNRTTDSVQYSNLKCRKE